MLLLDIIPHYYIWQQQQLIQNKQEGLRAALIRAILDIP
jgi:hypothetical protein